MVNISRNLYGCNYYVSLYIPENPMTTSLLKPSIPAEAESVKTLDAIIVVLRWRVIHSRRLQTIR